MKKTSRLSKRQDKRRLTAYLIQNSPEFAASRKLMPESLAKSLFEFVDRRMACQFGILKLSCYDLNDFYPATDRGLLWEPAVTLLTYAAWRRQDGILSAILRAGADPTAGLEIPDLERSVIRQHISSLHPQYAAWIVRTVVEMRAEGKLCEGRGCDCCQDLRPTRPLLWPCAHLTCELCFWKQSGSFSQVNAVIFLTIILASGPSPTQHTG
jgi:hypothetical protein